MTEREELKATLEAFLLRLDELNDAQVHSWMESIQWMPITFDILELHVRENRE